MRQRGGVEGARFENVRPGRQIPGVNAADDLGFCQQQQVVVAFQVVRMVGEARTAIVGFGELATLDHRPHRAVEHEDALGEQGAEQRFAGLRNSGHGLGGPEQSVHYIRVNGQSRLRSGSRQWGRNLDSAPGICMQAHTRKSPGSSGMEFA